MVLDPLSALGLAGNVVQFIDFSCTILSESRKIYRSVTESYSQNIELESIADSLHQFSVRLQPSQDGQRILPIGDEKFAKVLEACRGVADELLQAVRRLRVKEGPHKRWNSFQQALISVWQKEKLSELQSRLGFLREQVTLHMVSSISDGQGVMLRKVHTLEEETRSMRIDREQKIGEICDTLQSIRISHSSIPTRDDLDRFCLVLQESSAVAAGISKEVEILQSLHHKSMTVRRSKIAEAHKHTFEWIFNTNELPSKDVRSRIGFCNWLQSKSGIFWVSGKAGSGKSTLMKYICEDPRTTEILGHWAGTSSLITASFYFWNAGTDMQKSQQGLLQSLLYEILSQCPDLIPTVCQSRWETKATSNRFQLSEPWGPAELTKAFERLQEWASPTRKFCFFIDGLDEYEGDHFELLDIMVKMVKSPHIKLCLSSRPWNCFEDELGRDIDRKLYLQDLTREDIEVYAKTKLKRPANWASTYEDDRDYHAFTLEIVKRSQGVFLWVFLVVRSLQEGLSNGDSISMLQSRLRALPTDLEPFFEHILRSVDNVYQEKLGGMFQVALQAEEPLSLLTYSFLDEEDPDFSIRLPPSSLTLEEALSREDNMRRRINGRSKGLLEVSPECLEDDKTVYNPKWYRQLARDVTKIPTVEFLHRTVRDFLNTKHMLSVLKDMTPSSYNACLALSRGFLANFKSMPERVFVIKDHKFLEYALKFARRAEEQRGIPDNPTLNELERTSKVRFHLFLESANTFLRYTIEKGLVQYVNGRLNQQPQLLPSERGALLLSALERPLKHNRWEIDLVPMVKMLLKSGLSPNDPVGYSDLTCWRWFFKSYPRYAGETRKHEYWRSQSRLLLLWGADVQEASEIVELIMMRSEWSSRSALFNEVVPTMELLLSHGLDPNRYFTTGHTIWTWTVERIYNGKGSLEMNALSVAKVFLRYGADPLAYFNVDERSTQTKTMSVAEALTEVASRVKDDQGRQAFQKVLDDETAYFRSREQYIRKSHYSQPRLAVDERSIAEPASISESDSIGSEPHARPVPLGLGQHQRFPARLGRIRVSSKHKEKADGKRLYRSRKPKGYLQS